MVISLPTGEHDPHFLGSRDPLPPGGDLHWGVAACPLYDIDVHRTKNYETQVDEPSQLASHLTRQKPTSALFVRMIFDAHFTTALPLKLSTYTILMP